jgi:MOB kinase activator 1
LGCERARTFCTFLFSPASLRNEGTFRPVKKLNDGHRHFTLLRMSEATLGAGDVRAAVKLPPGESLNDWLAVSVIDFYNQLSCLWSPIVSACTASSCPEMTAGSTAKYAWQDNDRYRKPTMLPANEYITHVFLWVEQYMDDPKVFPEDARSPFPPNFLDVVKNIFKRLLRVYAHIYHHHRATVTEGNLEGHLNTSFRQFVFFAKEFQLIGDDQFAPMQAIIARFS